MFGGANNRDIPEVIKGQMDIMSMNSENDDDILIFTTEALLTNEQVDKMRNKLSEHSKKLGIKVLVVEYPWKVQVVKRNKIESIVIPQKI
jgi:hypothetical protein